MRAFLCLFIVGVSTLTLWAQEQAEDPGPVKVIDCPRKDPISYEKDIEPILSKHCMVCHAGAVKKGRLDLSNYEGLVAGGKRGSCILPGKSEASLLYQAMGRTGPPFMPPRSETDTVSPDELALVKLWIDQGAQAANVARERPKIVVGPPPTNVQPVRSLALAPDKSVLAVGRGNRINLYDPQSGKFLRALADPALKLPDGADAGTAHVSLVESLAYSPDGKLLVSGAFQEIAIWELETSELKQRIGGFMHVVTALAFSSDGKYLAVAGGAPAVEGEVKIYDTTTWTPIVELKNGHSDTVYGVAFSPDGTKLATGAADKLVKVWEMPSGKLLKTFEGHTHHVLDVGWMADGKLLASAGADNTVKIWDWEKGEQARSINAHGKQVTRLAFIGKKAEFATTGGDKQVKIFNATNGNAVRTFGGNTDYIYALAVSADGAIVAAGGQEGVVRVYNGANGQVQKTLAPP